jgi:hypothetical protein
MARRKPDAADFARANGSNVGDLMMPATDSTMISEADMPTGGDVGQQERRALAVILEDLLAWQDTREMAQTDDDRAALDAGIALRQQELLAKTDRYAAVMQRVEFEASWEKAQAERHTKRRKRCESVLEFLESYAIKAMQAAGVRRLEGRGATLKLQQRPGALVVTSECDVPDEYKAVTVTMPLPLWRDLCHALPQEKLIGITSEAAVVMKDKAKRAIKAGAEVPGADVTFADSLQVE